jgi:hypothetical protein
LGKDEERLGKLVSRMVWRIDWARQGKGLANRLGGWFEG